VARCVGYGVGMGTTTRICATRPLIEGNYARPVRDGPGLSAVEFSSMDLMMPVRDCTA
jgi:hypothetical protein